MLLQWTTFLSVHVHELDEHHQHMVDIINKLHCIAHESCNKELIAEIIDELADYANYHFGAEEARFEITDYPLTDEHIEQHLEYRERLKEFKDMIEAGTANALEQLEEFLFTWWTTHITTFDQKYIPFVKEED